MNIILSELKSVSQIILGKLASKKTDLVIEIDWYWTVMLGDAYDFSAAEREVVIGSVIDDWSWLKKILLKENPATIIDYERLGNMIRIIGEELCKERHEKLFLTLHVADVAQLCDLLLSKAQQAGFEAVDIDFEQYWCVAPQETYNFDKKPTCLQRSLVEDWSVLKKVLNTNEPVEKDYERLGRMLMAIGEVIDRDMTEKKVKWLSLD